LNNEEGEKGREYAKFDKLSIDYLERKTRGLVKRERMENKNWGKIK
jgi:hypothetical protein